LKSEKLIARSGTSIIAMVRKAEFAQMKPASITRLSISIEEASETDFWISLLEGAYYIDEKMYQNLSKDCSEPTFMLVSSLKTSKSKLAK
jgi:four helix bundle protein